MLRYVLPLLAVIFAIAITTTMDFTGYTNFSAFPLLGIIIVFWLIQRQSKSEFGLKFGQLKYYGFALLYPTLVLGLTALISYLYGDFLFEAKEPKNEIINMVAGVIIGPIALILTEEGFFRGWLWGAFKKTGMTPTKILYLTTGLFVIWHISAVVSGTEYGLPLTQVPIYLINAALLGLIWGTLRLASGSIIVPAVCHAVWNAFAYGLFGFGEKVGVLGVSNTFLFGPEVGYLGILLNGIFFLWLWKKTKTARLN